MTQSKLEIEAFFQKFPFLSNVVENINRVEKVSVSRIDEAILTKKPLYRGATGNCVRIEDSERAFILDAEGILLTQVKQKIDVIHNEAYSDNEYRDGESIGEAIAGKASAKYLVIVHTGYIIRDHYSRGGFSVELYLPPQSFTIEEWISQQYRQADETLDAQLGKINEV